VVVIYFKLSSSHEEVAKSVRRFRTKISRIQANRGNAEVTCSVSLK